MADTYREGGRVVIGGREFVVPKATLRVARDVAELQGKAAAGEAGDGFTASAEVLRLLLVKAAPGLTTDELLDLIDVDALGGVLAEVQEKAGFVKRSGDQGEAARP